MKLIARYAVLLCCQRELHYMGQCPEPWNVLNWDSPQTMDRPEPSALDCSEPWYALNPEQDPPMPQEEATKARSLMRRFLQNMGAARGAAHAGAAASGGLGRRLLRANGRTLLLRFNSEISFPLENTGSVAPASKRRRLQEWCVFYVLLASSRLLNLFCDHACNHHRIERNRTSMTGRCCAGQGIAAAPEGLSPPRPTQCRRW